MLNYKDGSLIFEALILETLNPKLDTGYINKFKK
jgi:hypothetical protein